MTNFRLIFSSRVLAAILWVAITAVWFGSRVDYIGGRPYTTAWGYDPKIYDPHRVSDPVAYSVFRHACESLYFEADDGQLYGVLAEDRFEYNEEGDLVSVILRSDVHFHDGTALTTSAVKDSFERLKLHGVSPLYEQLKDVKIIVRDAVTLEFHLPTPNRDFVRLVLSNPYAAIVNDVNRDDSIFVNCTGPYKFVEELYRPDAEIVLVRHKDYLWPPSIFSNRGPATIAQLHFLFIPDRKERFDRLLGGELCSLSP